VLSIIFAVAVFFGMLPIIRLLDQWVFRGLFPDWNPWMSWGFEPWHQFIDAATPIGYVCLAAVMGLIVAGFITKRQKLTALGVGAFFLPTFGYFAGYMWFFLAGLGVLKVLWLPFWDQPINLLHLGDIAFVPYMIPTYLSALGGLDAHAIAVFLAVGVWVAGFSIFLLGTIAWLYGKVVKQKIVTFWIYKYSRHPQYLGYILWSYGVMLQASLGYESYPGVSLPWVISSLIVVCMAWAEEIDMRHKDEEAYAQYRESAPFMLPLPKFVTALATAPIRMLFGTTQPESRKEIVGAFAVYCLIFLVLSLPFVLLDWPPLPDGWRLWPYNVWPFSPW
jgi:protein-S-isoprenylcysteine O-methyltransferase Ste14